ncbi:MAG: hypothetical protein ACK505_12370 [Flavobacteriales bacterium]|jgi:hypothetical protein
MTSPFDGIQAQVFSTVSNVFGSVATWTPSRGGETLQAKVLFNDPTESQKLILPNYDPINPMMEYHRGYFEGLKESIDSGETEIVIISGIEFWVRDVNAYWDGKTYRATLQRKQ